MIRRNRPHLWMSSLFGQRLSMVSYCKRIPTFIIEFLGPGDVNGLMPRIVCAAAYVEIKEKMKFL